MKTLAAMTEARAHKLLQGLYVITDTTQVTSEQLLQNMHKALQGGARLIQYRDKSADPTKRVREATQLKSLCQQYHALLIVNDDVELAAFCKADGVHLGRDDTHLRTAREQLGKHIVIGLSCYDSFERAVDAQKQGADYIAFGSFYPSPTKPGATRADIQLITQAKQNLHIPICVIGGITTENAPPLLAAGADMLAVISAIFQSADIQKTAADFARLFFNKNPWQQ